IIDEEIVPQVPGDDQVRIAIIVVIGSRDAHTVEGDGETGALRDVLKGAVASITVQAHSWLGLSDSHVALLWPVGAIDQQDVWPPVPIIIQESDASADGFRVPLVTSRSGIMRERYPGCSGHIRKPDGGWSNGT